jgi:NADH-quinone oxidoreductase subunit L
MILLAFLSVVAGWIGIAEGSGFKEWVRFPGAGHEPFSLGLAVVSVAVALAGLGLGYRLYATYRERDPMLNMGALTTVLVNKYYLDDLYMKGVVRPVQYGLSRAVYWTNQNILDGLVNGAAWAMRKLSGVVNDIDRYGVDGAVNGMAIGAGFFGRGLRRMQTGNVQRYAVFLFVGVAVLAVLITRFG